jgi:hypothetical protein
MTEVTERAPRRRGAINGLLLVLLGAWGALVPFFGPLIRMSYTPDTAWTFTWGRFWLEVLPGVAVVLGGLGLLAATLRPAGVFWGWLAALGGAWFVVGPAVSRLWSDAATGSPTAGTAVGRLLQELLLFSGLGVVIVFLAAVALGRFTVRDTRVVSRGDTVRTYPVDADDVPEQRVTDQSGVRGTGLAGVADEETGRRTAGDAPAEPPTEPSGIPRAEPRS